MKNTIRTRDVLRLSAFPVILASLCCLAPVILVAFGLSTVAFATSLTNTLDGKYKWLFILVGVLMLGVSIFYYLRRQNICSIDQAKKRKNEIINILAITLVVATIVYLLFFYGLVYLAGHLLHIW